MSNQRIDLHSDFDISFKVYLGDKDAGADGMAFVLHNDPFGADAIGGGGGAWRDGDPQRRGHRVRYLAERSVR